MQKSAEILTRKTILKIDLAGDINTVTCRGCGESIKYNQKDAFIPFSVWTGAGGRKRNITIKTNKQLVKNFLEEHFGKHMRGE